jgi:hypothetical protein
MRTLVLVFVFVGSAFGCECRTPSVSVALERASIVFRATIVELRPSDRPSALHGMVEDTQKVIRFKVIRVWKGNIGETFEMPALLETTACWGFWPDFVKIGNELLVYASPFSNTTEYVTDVCTRTRLAKDASSDFRQLGLGEDPKRRVQMGRPAQRQ